jgi:hypothetical protein
MILTVDQAAEELVSLKGAAFRACVRTPSPISVPGGTAENSPGR